MQIRFDQDGSVRSLETHIKNLEDNPRVQSILVLACDENGYTKDSLDPTLQSLTKPCFGGIFPQVLYKGERYTKGAVFVGLDAKTETSIIEELNNPENELDNMLQGSFSGHDTLASTMFVFVDGLSSGIGRLLDSLFNHFGLEIDYIGGGAGSLSLASSPCVISNQGLIQDGAVLAIVNLKGGVGVSHGWEPITDVLKVTESEGNRIISLNWQPAFSVYREFVEEHSTMSFASQPFFDIAKAYPFGIAKLDAEMVIRDPLMHEDDTLVCVGEVPQGAFVHVMNGNNETLIKAAGHALELAQSDYNGPKPGLMVFVDCISRALFLGEDFHKETQAVKANGLTMAGALTLGEIANNGREYLEFYNKTSVVGLLPG